MKNISGQRFGHLTALDVFEKRGKRKYWRVCCDCGHEKMVLFDNLVSGGTKSCGCMKSQLLLSNKTTHGLTKTREYVAWASARSRCYRVKGHSYKNHGGRGIVMCDRWLNDFSAFFSDMGPRPSRKHSLDRINNDGNYEPGNCRWALGVVQHNNKRSNVRVKLYGQDMTIAQFATRISVPTSSVFAYLRYKGMSPEDILWMINKRRLNEISK